jgi:hypothetical protein
MSSSSPSPQRQFPLKKNAVDKDDDDCYHHSQQDQGDDEEPSSLNFLHHFDPRSTSLLHNNCSYFKFQSQLPIPSNGNHTLNKAKDEPVEEKEEPSPQISYSSTASALRQQDLKQSSCSIFKKKMDQVNLLIQTSTACTLVFNSMALKILDHFHDETEE